MAKVIIVCIAAFICCNAFSQSYDNNWIFGDSASLNFESVDPVSGVSSIMTYEACASISDSIGNLLFYTNGEKVWNRNHEIMENGEELEIGGVLSPFGSSLTQGVIVVPKPEIKNMLYVIQIQAGSIDGLNYSVIDMSLNDGLGKVSEKNIHFFDIKIQEKMQSVKHGNGRDWWLLVRRFDTITAELRNIEFVRFLITPEGIEGPFYQNIGPTYDENFDTGWGQMIFSQDGSKLLFPRQSELDIFDFDRCTGELSNLIRIQNLDMAAYGCSFSPDGSKIYVNGACEKKLYQFCLSCDGEPIDSTKELVYDGPTGSYCQGQQLLGPDGKIYLVTGYSTLPNDIFNVKNQNLSVINSPNEIYPLCNFDTNTVSLGTRRVIFGLPNMPNYNLGALAGSECDTLGTAINNVMEGNEIIVYPNPVNDNLTLHSSNNSELNYTIQTIQGQIILRGKIVKQSTINFKNYSVGIYLVEIYDSAGKLLEFKKIVKS